MEVVRPHYTITDNATVSQGIVYKLSDVILLSEQLSSKTMNEASQILGRLPMVFEVDSNAFLVAYDVEAAVQWYLEKTGLELEDINSEVKPLGLMDLVQTVFPEEDGHPETTWLDALILWVEHGNPTPEIFAALEY